MTYICCSSIFTCLNFSSCLIVSKLIMSIHIPISILGHLCLIISGREAICGLICFVVLFIIVIILKNTILLLLCLLLLFKLNFLFNFLLTTIFFVEGISKISELHCDHQVQNEVRAEEHTHQEEDIKHSRIFSITDHIHHRCPTF